MKKSASASAASSKSHEQFPLVEEFQITKEETLYFDHRQKPKHVTWYQKHLQSLDNKTSPYGVQMEFKDKEKPVSTLSIHHHDFIGTRCGLVIEGDRDSEQYKTWLSTRSDFLDSAKKRTTTPPSSYEDGWGSFHSPIVRPNTAPLLLSKLPNQQQKDLEVRPKTSAQSNRSTTETTAVPKKGPSTVTTASTTASRRQSKQPQLEPVIENGGEDGKNRKNVLKSATVSWDEKADVTYTLPTLSTGPKKGATKVNNADRRGGSLMQTQSYHTIGTTWGEPLLGQTILNASGQIQYRPLSYLVMEVLDEEDRQKTSKGRTDDQKLSESKLNKTRGATYLRRIDTNISNLD